MAPVRAEIPLGPDGLPDCAESVADELLCNGFATTSSAVGPGRNLAPDWLWNPRYHDTLFAGAWLEAAEARCASTIDEAEMIFREDFDPRYFYEININESDARWFDVEFDRTESAWKVYRVPRCAVFVHFASLGNLLPGTAAAPRRIMPIWQVAMLPPSQVDFFDLARTIEVFRHLNSNGSRDWSSLFAIGSATTAETWRLRSCRLDGMGVRTDNGVEVGVWQSDYTMDVASGIASYSGAVVRTLGCDDVLLQEPPW
jgi:hypothetical protein